MSNNLDRDQVTSHQASAEVTINDSTGQIDAALTDSLSVAVDGTNAVSFTALQLRRHNYFTLTNGGAAGPVTVTIPAVARGMFVLQNSTGQDASVSITGQTWPVVDMADGDVFVLHADGTDCRAVGGGGGVDLGAITDQYLLYNNTGVVGGLPQSTFLKADGSQDIDAGTGGNFNFNPTSGVVSTIATKSAFFDINVDSDAANYTYLFSASGFAPGADGDAELGDTSFHWEKLWTNGVDCTGPVEIRDQNALRLYEAVGGGTNYLAFKAAAAMAASVTLTYPNADAVTAGSFMESDAAGTLTWKQPPYDFAGFFAGAPGVSELITRIVVNRTVVMPQNLTGSQGYISVAATAQTDFDIQVNGVSKGTMRFAAAATTATFIFAAAVTLVAGDLVSIVAPNPADATAANLSFSFKCYRTN